MAEEKLKRELGFRDVILFYIVSSLSLRWIATAAATGQSAITVWVLGFCGFFLPLAGCVLELSSRYPQEGGLYIWTREAYGEFAGFMACSLPLLALRTWPMQTSISCFSRSAC
jgi:amino acid transporter